MFKFFYLLFCIILSTVFCYSQSNGEVLNGVNMKRNSMWPKAYSGETSVEVTWENPDGYSDEIEIVKQAIQESWEKVANIKFTNWGRSSYSQKGIRILTKDGHPHSKGLGTEINGVYGGVELNFSFGNFPCHYSREECIKFIAVHEFGHALGLSHEQNRDDCLCNELPQGTNGGWYITTCDINSVMNYCNPDWNNSGNLSYYDILGIQTIYGKKSIPLSSENSIFKIIDNLGLNQIWENVYIEINNESQVLHVDSRNNSDFINYTITGDGYINYKLYSSTVLNNNSRVSGYGEGSIYVSNNTNLTYEVILNGYNQFGNAILTLQKKIE